MNSPKSKKRLFVGLPLDDEAKRGVRGVMKGLKRARWHIAWEPAEKWHMTLLFLGDIEEDRIVSAIEIMRNRLKGSESIVLTFKGLGAFPNLLLPRTIWLGVRGNLQGLHRIRKPLYEGLVNEGIAVDNKPFNPHVTLGRVTRNAGRKARLEMGKVVRKKRVMEIKQQWQVEEIALFESVISRDGSRYTKLYRFELEKNNADKRV